MEEGKTYAPRYVYRQDMRTGEKVRHTSDFVNWDTSRDEVYKVRPIFYAIPQIKAWLKENPQPIVALPVEPFVALIAGMKERGEWKDTERPIDPSIPVLMAPWGFYPPGFLPIDGWRRLDLAIQEGVEHVPAIMLDDPHIPTAFWMPPRGSKLLTPDGEIHDLYD